LTRRTNIVNGAKGFGYRLPHCFG